MSCSHKIKLLWIFVGYLPVASLMASTNCPYITSTIELQSKQDQSSLLQKPFELSYLGHEWHLKDPSIQQQFSSWLFGDASTVSVGSCLYEYLYMEELPDGRFNSEKRDVILETSTQDSITLADCPPASVIIQSYNREL